MYLYEFAAHVAEYAASEAKGRAKSMSKPPQSQSKKRGGGSLATKALSQRLNKRRPAGSVLTKTTSFLVINRKRRVFRPILK